MRQTVKTIVLTTLLLMVGSCSINTSVNNPTHIPYESFIFVKGDAPLISMTICDPKKPDECTTKDDKDGFHIVGSGVAVANSVIHARRQYIMTAGHICNAVDIFKRTVTHHWKEEKNKDINVKLTMVIHIVDNEGNSHVGKVIGLNTNKDLCILAVQGTHIPVVILADDYPPRGSKIINLAAPLGVWEPGTTSRFDGYYSGPITCDDKLKKIYSCKKSEPMWSLFSLPAAPGSSGSPIFNNKNQLIGIVVMVTTLFPHNVYAVRIEDIKALLSSIIKFEKSSEGLIWDLDISETDTDSGTAMKTVPEEGTTT